jgi:cysteine desulfurase
MKNSPKRIYADYASTTPVAPEVFLAMKPFLHKQFHNPSALYREGVFVKEEIEQARKSIANILLGHPNEIVFTASGTEADNMAVLGIFEKAKEHIANPHIIISAIEHPAILELVSEINRRGGGVSIIPVEENGIINLTALQKALSKKTVLVSVMYANNEIGTVQPIRQIAKVVRDFRKKSHSDYYPLVHTDASQAANYLPLATNILGIDLMTLDASKVYGPKGIGLLWIRRGVDLHPLIFGGGQERGLRSGTENAGHIVGFARALTLAERIREKESRRLLRLRDLFIAAVLKQFPRAKLNGESQNRLPNNINICFPGIDGELAVLRADASGILCSSASSCMSLSDRSDSYVLTALGDKKCADSSLRFSFGRFTAQSEVRAIIKRLPAIIEQSARS